MGCKLSLFLTAAPWGASLVLAGAYRENTISSLDAAFPEEREDFTDGYEYLSDSDLDEEEYLADHEAFVEMYGNEKITGHEGQKTVSDNIVYRWTLWLTLYRVRSTVVRVLKAVSMASESPTNLLLRNRSTPDDAEGLRCFRT